MGRGRTSTLLLAVALAVGSTGCARVLSSYDLAPNGLERREDELRRSLANGRADSALVSLDSEDGAAPSDLLLRLLYQGTISHYAGKTDESVMLLDWAAALAEDRYTRSVSRGALSLVTNDRVLAYEPSFTERLMVHYYAALGWLHQGKFDDAAVEARRLGYVLQRAADDGQLEGRNAQAAFFHTFAATVFEAAGYDESARVAHRNAAALLGSETADSLDATPADSGDVVILVEQGFVAHRVENAVMIPLLEDEVKTLSSGGAGEKLAAAALVSTRVLAGLAVEPAPWRGVSRRGGTVYVSSPVRHTSGRYDHDDDEDDDDDDDDYLLRVAWPVYVGDDAHRTATVTLEGGGVSVEEVIATDVSEGVVADFERERVAVLTRAIVRAAAKFAATKAAEKKAEEEAESEAAGDVVGALVNLGAVLTERADTRSWHLVPDRVSMLRLRLPAGEHVLHVDAGTWVETLRVDVRPGETKFVSVRSWR